MIQALLFDLDGTLYDARALRRRMAGDFLRAFLRAPRRGWREAEILSAYREAQERMRSLDGRCDVATRQIEMTCARTGRDRAEVEPVVAHWMHQAPLPHLAPCMPKSVPALLEWAHAAGMRLGVCSDYPARAKLAAMGIDRFFDCVVAAQDEEVGCFKPNPRILEVGLAKLGVAPKDALYAGDRPDGDGEAAARAGMRYVNIIYGPSAGGITIEALFASLRCG